MKVIKYMKLCLLFAFSFAGCQTAKYAPGFDFGLFRNTPVYHMAKAVEIEDTVAITEFMASGTFSVDYKEAKFGHTLLLLAVINNKELSVTKLLDLGADPNARAFDNSNPFISACTHEFSLKNPRKILLLLIEFGADVNAIQMDTTYDQFGKRKHAKITPLRSLCVGGSLESVKVLVEHGANLDAYEKNEHAILSTAVLSGKLDIVKYLMIDKKAPIPDYVIIRQPGTKDERKMTISDLLNEHKYQENSREEELKREILTYLKEQGKR
jgi:hypothetical protein